MLNTVTEMLFERMVISPSKIINFHPDLPQFLTRELHVFCPVNAWSLCDVKKHQIRICLTNMSCIAS